MKGKGFFRCTAVLVMFALCIPALLFAAEREVDLDAPPQALVVYGALHEYEISRILDRFERDTGIRTEFIRLSAGALAARVMAEKARPGGDIFLGGPSDTHESIIPEGVLRPYKSPSLDDIDQFFYHPEHYWSGFYVGPLALAINRNRWKASFGDDPYPKTWEDLLDPKFRGMISMASPAASGTAYTIVATQFFRLGEEAGWEFLEKLHPNIAHYTSSGAAPVQQASTGEVLMGMAFAHDIMKPMASGFPLDLVFPENTGWEIGGLSIINGGPNPKAAEMFVDWMLKRDAQQLHTDLSLRISTHPDVALPPGATPLTALKLVDYDGVWAGANRTRIVEEFNNRFF